MRGSRLRIAIVLALVVAVLAIAPVALVVQPFVIAIASHSPSVDPARLEAHVRHLSVDLYPRSYDQRENLEQAAQYILDELKAAGGRVDVQDVILGDSKFKNLVAHFGPESGPLMVVGAHYDSFGDTYSGARFPRGYTSQTHTPGADDNASGVAGLLELAHLIGQEPSARSIDLVAYTLEEPPHFRTGQMGSVWHARSLRAAKREVSLMLSLEMIGYFSDEPGSQAYPFPAMAHLYSERGDFVALVGKLSNFGATRRAKALMAGATDLPVYSINAPTSLQGIDFSDHMSYWNEGFAALMVTDTAFLRNSNYHEAEDTYEKLDYVRMAKVVQAVYAVARDY